MNCKINKHNINSLLKKDLAELKEKIRKVDELLKTVKNEKVTYKLLMYKRALQIIMVSKIVGC